MLFRRSLNNERVIRNPKKSFGLCLEFIVFLWFIKICAWRALTFISTHITEPYLSQSMRIEILKIKCKWDAWLCPNVTQCQYQQIQCSQMKILYFKCKKNYFILFICLSVIFVSRQEKLAVLLSAKQLTSTLKSVRNAASCTYGRRRDATFPSCSCSSRVIRFSLIPSQIFLWSLLWFLPAPWFVSVHLYHLKKKRKSYIYKYNPEIEFGPVDCWGVITCQGEESFAS